MAGSVARGTREKILEACRRKLEEQGADVGMGEIAKAAGVSRQAVYLHFANRAELLVATARHADMAANVDELLSASRGAPDGVSRLLAYLDAWAQLVPQIYPVARALLAMKETDASAGAAWTDRMAAQRHGCQAAIDALEKDGHLVAGLSNRAAVDSLWTLMSVRNYEHWVMDCGWTVEAYRDELKRIASAAFIKAG
ncbi:TetR/AcrR family transcriptional regulator [Hyphobacterium sp. HN65]|uniref:TetR/AcrR family transcriptional regulator n=1 Tax=Hyphobacterium lacteum TaxID=3116575 RepID=A0ABU7LNQ7_9PROT|nr:TetR/AcrR family transcriptional regulator [Hyphobacterium sp. HN65]MEE2525523.1 TetR/AcrR family transcriptional regulator [Hyphobacterium sp. HN65]